MRLWWYEVLICYGNSTVGKVCYMVACNGSELLA